MDIAPIDLLHKRFARALRGYDPTAVDDFLRQVEASFSAARAEAARLADRVENLEREIARYREMESTLEKALALAEGSAARLRDGAQQEADRIVRDAQSYATATREHVDREMDDLRRQRARFAREFRSLLMTHMEELDDRVSLPQSVRPSGDDPHA